MAVQVGNQIPEAMRKIMGEKGPEDLTTKALSSGKKVVLFAP
ncbi:MAG: hypothetical protein WD558_08735 [Pseudomonadales bacterium]